MTVDGKEIECDGTREINLTLQGIWLKTKVIVLSKRIDGINIIIGMDVISQLGGVMIGDGRVIYLGTCQLCAVTLEDVQVKENVGEPMEVEKLKK